MSHLRSKPVLFRLLCASAYRSSTGLVALRHLRHQRAHHSASPSIFSTYLHGPIQVPNTRRTSTHQWWRRIVVLVYAKRTEYRSGCEINWLEHCYTPRRQQTLRSFLRVPASVFWMWLELKAQGWLKVRSRPSIFN